MLRSVLWYPVQLNVLNVGSLGMEFLRRGLQTKSIPFIIVFLYWMRADSRILVGVIGAAGAACIIIQCAWLARLAHVTLAYYRQMNLWELAGVQVSWCASF